MGSVGQHSLQINKQLSNADLDAFPHFLNTEWPNPLDPVVWLYGNRSLESYSTLYYTRPPAFSKVNPFIMYYYLPLLPLFYTK